MKKMKKTVGSNSISLPVRIFLPRKQLTALPVRTILITFFFCAQNHKAERHLNNTQFYLSFIDKFFRNFKQVAP